MTIKVLDLGRGGLSVRNIPSDNDPEVRLDIDLTDSGDVALTIRKPRKTVSFEIVGRGGGSQNPALAAIFGDFARKLFEACR